MPVYSPSHGRWIQADIVLTPSSQRPGNPFERSPWPIVETVHLIKCFIAATKLEPIYNCFALDLHSKWVFTSDPMSAFGPRASRKRERQSP